MVRPRGHVIAALTLVAVAGCAPHAADAPIMSYEAYHATSHPVPYVLEARRGAAVLLYYGAAHSNDPAGDQGTQIEALWNSFRPTFALNEGGDPPAEASRDIAIGRHAEAGLLRFLSARDRVPVASLDPTLEQEATHLRERFSAEELVTFYTLRWAMQDAQRPAQFRAASLDEAASHWLWSLTSIPALADGPATLAAFEAACRRRAPHLSDWRTVPPEWFDPAAPEPPAFTNAISRAASEYRDRAMVETLVAALEQHERVLAVVGASHVVMQEGALRARVARVQPVPTPVIAASEPETASLLGTPLYRPLLAPDRRAQLERDLAKWSERTEAASPTEDDYIWHGRTLAYLYRYHEAVAVFSRGLARFPDSHRLLRHRGHRHLTLRDIAAARDDLARADRLITDRNIPDGLEPDGAPNRFNIPRSTTNTNILYHLGLAHYLAGDFHAASDAFERCLRISPNDDMRVAAINWLYLSLRRDRNPTAARAALEHVLPAMDVLENETYHRLCLVYRGDLAPEQALPVDPADTVGALSAMYALAALDDIQGRPVRAAARLGALASSPFWPSFAVLAAEADLARAADAATVTSPR